MALNSTQLNDIKTKMEAGSLLRAVVRDDYSSEKVKDVRAALIAEFGKDGFRNMMLDSRLQGKTVEELNPMIVNAQGRLDKITAIRDSKL